MSIFYYTDRRVNGQDFESGAIANVYYDTESDSLGVEFNKGFNVYVYEGVAESTFHLFVEADSLHEFYTNYIQGNYGESRQYSAVSRREEPNPRVNGTADHSDENAWEVTSKGDALFQPENKAFNALIAQANNTAKYGVKWTGSFNSSDERMGPFEFVTEANSIDEALLVFNDTVNRLHGHTIHTKIVSVTRYFE